MKTAPAALLALFLSLPFQSCDTSSADEGPPNAHPVAAVMVGHAEEARTFLGRPDAVIWIDGMDQRDVEQLVAEMFAAGMTEAQFAGIEDLGGTCVSSRVLLRLPRDLGTRQRLFGAYNQFCARHGGQAIADGGEDILVLPQP